MEKATTIIFLYDTQLLKHEEDDPNSAILYFYPPWVSDHQKTALCGQLMGTTMCLKSIFSMPKLVLLQTGKFYLIENGRYILVVGTDRNILDKALEDKAQLVFSLLVFFHKDFVTLAEQYQGENLSAKLYHIFDTYLKLLFLGGCIFSFTPIMDLNKTESNVVDNARDCLDNCKNVAGVLGGMILYQNKIIYTQLSIDTSRKVAYSDPFRIKNPAEISDIELPQGVKLVNVYIPLEEFNTLFTVVKWNSVALISSSPAKTDYLPSTSTKPDAPLLQFTSVPEDSTYSPHKRSYNSNNKSKGKRSRPTSLNLKSFSLDASGEFQKTPGTPYWKQKSTVCTPMSEHKSFVEVTTKNVFTEADLTNLTMAPLRRTHSLNSIQSQYSIGLKKCKSIHDPLFPWLKGKSALSQYYMKHILEEKGKMGGSMVHRKRSLMLPIKPHNACEVQRTDMKSPGYCTPLMNKLSISDKPQLSKNLLKSSYIDKINQKKTETTSELKQLILFMCGEGDLVLAALLLEKCSSTINQLHTLCLEQLATLEEQLKSALELPKTSGEMYSMLKVEGKWGSTKQSGSWNGGDMYDLRRLHADYDQWGDIGEIYLRKHDSVIYSQRADSTETFFKEPATANTGLLPPSDTLSTIQQTAKKILEKNHNMTIK